MEVVNQGHIFFIIQNKTISMLKLRKLVMAKKIAFVILFCVPLEIMQPLIRADSAVACVAIHNSAMLSYLLNGMR